ncbi:large ribosomal subunit protein bL32m [Prorops nasuta]|uniref:large ribosomal subunit protein bL32m n=1 Tax=Prorops nasuta TaxID=863751 RepID=UPI0034CDB029
MALNMIHRLSNAFKNFERMVEIILGRGFPPEALCAVDCSNVLGQSSMVQKKNSWSLKEIMDNGILWAVPKSRRTLEKRMKRRYGDLEKWPHSYKFPVAKTNILSCVHCGHDYEYGTLCGHCYERVKMETKEMQDAIQKELGLEPVEQDVVVLYEDDIVDREKEFWKNQRVVELKKKRPEWFHKNLLQTSTQEPSDSKEVKPTDLA